MRIIKALALILGGIILFFFYISSNSFENGRKSQEGATKGNLGAIRTALSMYYEDMGKNYPRDFNALTIGGNYMSVIPSTRLKALHSPSSAVLQGKVSDDAGGWLYNNIVGDLNFGKIAVNCTHTDMRGAKWESY